MKLLLASDSESDELYALILEPSHMVFQVIPQHGGTWTAKFIFGSAPPTDEVDVIEKAILQAVRDEAD